MNLQMRKKGLTRHYQPFSTFWWSIAQTRLAECLIVFAFTFKNPNVRPTPVYIAIAVYSAFNLLLGLVDSDDLKRITVRVLPSAADILFISLIVYYTGGPKSTWFVIYVFPIISVSKYLEYKGSLLLALSAILAYILLNYLVAYDERLDVRTLVFRCLFLLAAALLAGNLARTRRKEEIRLVKIFEEINNEILSDISTKRAFKMILRRALEMTSSEMGHIRLVDKTSPTRELKVVAALGHPKNYEWDLRPLDDSLSHSVVISKKPLKIPSIRKDDLKHFLGTYFKLHRPRPKSALFVPLMTKGEVTAVLAVYSHKRYHYIKRAATRLGGLAPLITVALKTADFNRDLNEFNKELNVALDENKRRLDLLYEIGSQLSAGQPLNDLFQKVVELIYNHLDCEEAALFIPDDHDNPRLKKVAVRGPTLEITKQLESVELSYARGQSLAGKIFETKRPIFLKEVDPVVEYVDEYIEILPSKKILHYVGVPLIIGPQILGVIRVINKKSPRYSADNPELSKSGFDEIEDTGLLRTIAIQVAVSIRYTEVLMDEKLAAIGNMAKTVGHEIKTNLGTALNYVEGLKSLCDPDDDAEKLEIYTDMQDALWEARNQLQNMLMAAKPKITQKLTIEVGDIFEDFKDKLEREAESTQIDFAVNYPTDGPELLADVSQLRQVFANLFNNSAYAIQERASSELSFRGCIEVSARFIQNRLRICWKDNGIGISNHDLLNLFTPFFTSKDSGNGLGLFICKTIIENHDGTISVVSELNKGTSFLIELPVLSGERTGDRDASTSVA